MFLEDGSFNGLLEEVPVGKKVTKGGRKPRDTFAHLRELFGVNDHFYPINPDELDPDGELARNKPSIATAIIDHVNSCRGITVDDAPGLETAVRGFVAGIHRVGLDGDGTAHFEIPPVIATLQEDVRRAIDGLLLVSIGTGTPERHTTDIVATIPEPPKEISQHEGILTGFDMLDAAIEKMVGDIPFPVVVFSCPHDDIREHFFTCLEVRSKKKTSTGFERLELLTMIKDAVGCRMGEKEGKGKTKSPGKWYQSPLPIDGKMWDHELRQLERVCANRTMRRIIVVDFDDLSCAFSGENFRKSRIAYRYVSALIKAKNSDHCVVFRTQKSPETVHAFLSHAMQVRDHESERIDNPAQRLFGTDTITQNSPNCISFHPTGAQYEKWRQIDTRRILEIGCRNLHENLGELWLSNFRREFMPFINELAWVLSFRSGVALYTIPGLDGGVSELDTLRTIVNRAGPKWSEGLINFLTKQLSIDMKQCRQKAWEQYCLAVHGAIDTDTDNPDLFHGLVASQQLVDNIKPDNAYSGLRTVFEYLFGKLVHKERKGLLTIIQKFKIPVWGEDQMDTYYGEQDRERQKSLDDSSLAKFLFETSVVPAMPAKEI